jgi:hypothetical protein
MEKGKKSMRKKGQKKAPLAAGSCYWVARADKDSLWFGQDT